MVHYFVKDKLYFVAKLRIRSQRITFLISNFMNSILQSARLLFYRRRHFFYVSTETCHHPMGPGTTTTWQPLSSTLTSHIYDQPDLILISHTKNLQKINPVDYMVDLTRCDVLNVTLRGRCTAPIRYRAVALILPSSERVDVLSGQLGS